MKLDKRQKARLNRALGVFQNATVAQFTFICGKDPEKRDECIREFNQARRKLLETVEGIAGQMYSRGQTYGIAKGRTREIDARDKTRIAPDDKWGGWGEPQQVSSEDDFRSDRDDD